MTPAGMFREWRRRWQLRTWRRRGYPTTVQRSYWSEREHRRDADRLRACGYREVDETELRVDAAVVAARDANPYLGVNPAGPERVMIADAPSGPLMRVIWTRQAQRDAGVRSV